MTTKKPQGRKDGRQPLLVYLDPEVIRTLKTAALQQGEFAYEIVENVLRKEFKEKLTKRETTRSD